LDFSHQPTEAAAFILQLSTVTGLQDLRLIYSSLPSAAAGAAAWCRLPQLRALQVHNEFWERDDVECQAVLEGMARATSLTSVKLRVPSTNRPEVPCGMYLAQLQNLQELVLKHARSSRQDMLHLKKLTQLTALEFKNCSIDDATAVELLCALAVLRSLVIVQSDLQPQQEQGIRVLKTDAIVPLIKYQLKGLRDLDLSVPGVTDDSVGLLEGFTQLTKLSVGGLSEDMMKRLRQALVGCQVTSKRRGVGVDVDWWEPWY
jgi:hypothetical protein